MMKKDGAITASYADDPLDSWGIADLRFPLMGDAACAIITVAYLRQSGAIERMDEISFVSTEYDALVYAINMSSGTDEVNLTKPDGSPDTAAILRLRIARHIVASGRLTGVDVAAPTAA